MHLLPSAHVDSFARDHLPPAPTWPELRFDLPELRYPDRLNCGAELLDATIARLDGDRPCLRLEDGSVWSYEQLRAQTDRIARVLVEDLGVVPGNRVLLRGTTTPWLVACWLAVMKAGAVAVTVLAAQRRTELATMVGIAQVGHALCDARALEELEAVEAPGLRITPYGGRSDADLLALAAGKSDAPFPAVDTSADDVALIAFTSGTTGRPKGCMHFHRDVLAIADTFSAHVLRPTPDDVFTGTPPLGFTFGLGGLVVFPLRVGASALLLEQPSPASLPAAIERHRVSVLFTAPTAYRVLLDQAEEADLSSLRRCVSAGENLPAATWEAFHARTGLPLINGIGSTELLHIFVSAADADARPGVTGFPVPGFRARVVDPATGADAPDGTPGLLAVQGPTGCRYLDDPRQADYVHDGWNLTGDTYVRDPDGCFRYQARADDMIISAGYNIAGPEVEEALLRHPEVREAAVIGVPDETRGQVVKAFVVLAEGVPADEGTAKALQDFVKSTISAYKYPRQVEFRESLPRTPTGKLQRFRLRHE
ncbi:AMP-binding protein [Streptacidiphilus melanogenes]|uniref:AMP-binding protein n=1 Tax=Streptacidiphilus melanogenes TaxID=411235 RepID=UPI0005A69FFF|nr:AMP-binding protein [Streptacidiphilus melanogenes]